MTTTIDNEHKTFNVPNLRFPEFEGEWKRIKVSDLLEFYSTNSLSWDKLEYGTNNIQNLHYGLIHVGLPTMVDLAKEKLPNIIVGNEPKNFEVCKEGDIVFCPDMTFIATENPILYEKAIPVSEILEEKFTDEKTSDSSEKTEVLDFVEKSESSALSEEEKSSGKPEKFLDGGESSSAEDKKSFENASDNYLNDGQKNIEKIYDSPEENAVDMHENFNKSNDGGIDDKTRSSEIVDSENDSSIGM